MKPHDALHDYIENSELRVIVDGVFNARMSKDIAKNFDAGLYDVQLDDFRKCLDELKSISIKYPGNAKPVFYLYVVPDDNFVELLNYPYKDKQSGGCPVLSYDLDGFNNAYGISQNLLVGDSKVSVTRHVNRIHEFSHLICEQFGFHDRWFNEGFAELIPWYVLGYEKLVPGHIESMKSMGKIYTVNELLSSVDFSDTVSWGRCSFQRSYISSYLAMRAVVEHICTKYNLSRSDAIQKMLEIVQGIRFNKQWFIMKLAEIIDMDAEKLLNSTEYQNAVLNQIEQENKKTIIVNAKERE